MANAALIAPIQRWHRYREPRSAFEHQDSVPPRQARPKFWSTANGLKFYDSAGSNDPSRYSGSATGVVNDIRDNRQRYVIMNHRAFDFFLKAIAVCEQSTFFIP